MGSILDKNYIIASNRIKTLKTNQCCELSSKFTLSCRLLGIVFNMFEQLLSWKMEFRVILASLKLRLEVGSLEVCQKSSAVLPLVRAYSIEISIRAVLYVDHFAIVQ